MDDVDDDIEDEVRCVDNADDAGDVDNYVTYTEVDDAGDHDDNDDDDDEDEDEDEDGVTVNMLRC